MKNLKKNLIMLFALMLITTSFGQTTVVNDPANLAINTATKALQEIENQTSKGQLDAITKSLQINEKWEEALTKVSPIIAKSERVAKAFTIQKDIVSQ